MKDTVAVAVATPGAPGSAVTVTSSVKGEVKIFRVARVGAHDPGRQPIGAPAAYIGPTAFTSDGSPSGSVRSTGTRAPCGPGIHWSITELRQTQFSTIVLGSDTVSESVTLPADLVAGSYWLGVCANYDPAATPAFGVPETSLLDNCVASPVATQVARGALAITTTSLPRVAS